MDEARAAADELIQLKPGFTISSFLIKGYSFQDSERNEWFENLLVRAGLPE